MGDHDPVRNNPVTSKLRRLKPHHLMVSLLDDDKEVKLVVPIVGNKWQRLANMLDPLAWDSLKAFDKEGTYLGTVANPDADRYDDEEDEEDEEDDRDERMAKLIVGVVDKTLARAEGMFKAQLDANASIVRNVAESNKLLVETYRATMNATSASDIARRSTSDDGTAEMGSMIQNFLMLMAASNGGALGALGNMFGAAKPPIVDTTATKKEG